MTDTIPKQHLEAEAHVLGSLLLSPTAIDTTAETLTATDFYMPSHGVIYQVCHDLHVHGHPVDTITVIDRLDRDGTLEQVGGRTKIHELANIVPATANVGHYARIIRDMSQLRALRDIGLSIVTDVDSRDDDPREILDQAQQRVFALAQEQTRGDLLALEQTITSTYQRIVDRGAQPVTGIATGFNTLDTLTTGLHGGQLLVLAARPSMGKSALALTIAANVAVTDRQPVAFFSLEMSRDELEQRLLALRGGVNLQHVRKGTLDAGEHRDLLSAAAELAAAPLHIDDSGTIKPIEIRSKARRMKSRHGLGLIVVDYLQLLVGESKPENRTQEVSAISRALKAIARDLDVPVIALSQLNRGLELRHDKRPMLSDLRESGAIEQDADLVLFIYRDAIYNKEADDTEAELILAKHRNGPIDTFNVGFVKQRAEFRNTI